ncbi:MAG: hypothetical protein U9Q82_07045 [Chloroflexota bacterium]|nr:hypothetical protein [Chloroflexota bacterium]
MPKEASSLRIDKAIERYSREELNLGRQKLLNSAGYSGPGHIFNLAFVSPAEVDDFIHLTERGYFNEAIDIYEPGALEKFAEDGDPVHLLSDAYQTQDGYPILLPVNVSFTHTYGSWQFENSQQE